MLCMYIEINIPNIQLILLDAVTLCDPWDSSVHIAKIELLVYILPFIMVVKMFKLDNPKRSYAHLTFGVLKSKKWRNRLSKLLGLSLGQLPIGPEIISITPFKFQILISNFHTTCKTHKRLWFCKNLKIERKSPPQVFSAVSPFVVLHRSISFR